MLNPRLLWKQLLQLLHVQEAKLALMLFLHLDCVELLMISEQNLDLTYSMQIHKSV